MQKIYCRTAPSLGIGFEGTPESVWGTTEYEGDRDAPTVFFGLYGLPDFYSLWRHKGKKWILWAGSDIRHFKDGYWLDDKGGIRLYNLPLAKWIQDNCESWVENIIEYKELLKLGIKSFICPSFLGNVTNFKVSYQFSGKPKLYTSVSGDDFELYGWNLIPKLAQDNTDIEFHLYGSSSCIPCSGFHNVFFHGRVPIEQMNEETKEMQGALRLTKLDGFSEILAKSILWGQYPVSLIPYPHMVSINRIGTIKNNKEPNIKGRDYFLGKLNKFPFNVKNNFTA